MTTNSKPFNSFKILAFILISTSLFTACKKENLQPASTNSLSTDNIADADEAGIYKTASGNTKLVLQPDATAGQDAWVQWYQYDPTYADANTATSFELKVESWTIGGGVINLREFIKFSDLSQIPSTSSIIGAKLFLYGLDPGDQSFPQGNSYYPGSQYNSYGENACYVDRVVSDWDENTITWNNQPLINEKNRAILAASTSQWNYNASIDVTKLVQAAVRISNFGFRISMENETPYHSIGFYSSDGSNPRQHPKLVIVYK
jgi:hypothetical protein